VGVEWFRLQVDKEGGCAYLYQPSKMRNQMTITF